MVDQWVSVHGIEADSHATWSLCRNPFDIVGARAAGFNAIWVDRKGKGWLDQLGEPTNVVQSLRDVIDIISTK